MSHEKLSVSELINSLKQQRDELALKIHLGAAETKEEWDKATEKLDEMTRDYDPLKEAVGESAESVGESLKLVGEEVLKSFNRIRQSL